MRRRRPAGARSDRAGGVRLAPRSRGGGHGRAQRQGVDWHLLHHLRLRTAMGYRGIQPTGSRPALGGQGMSTLIRMLRVAAAGALVALAVAAPAGAATVKLSGGSTTLKLDPGDRQGPEGPRRRGHSDRAGQGRGEGRVLPDHGRHHQPRHRSGHHHAQRRPAAARRRRRRSGSRASRSASTGRRPSRSRPARRGCTRSRWRSAGRRSAAPGWPPTSAASPSS